MVGNYCVRVHIVRAYVTCTCIYLSDGEGYDQISPKFLNYKRIDLKAYI